MNYHVYHVKQVNSHWLKAYRNVMIVYLDVIPMQLVLFNASIARSVPSSSTTNDPFLSGMRYQKF
jgi:hypothetical protein